MPKVEGQVIDIYKDVFELPQIKIQLAPFLQIPEAENVAIYVDSLLSSEYKTVSKNLNDYKYEKQLSDWMFYQIVRRTANHLSPKSVNYNDYTLVKWMLMREAGYDMRLAVIDHQLLLYTQTDEEVYDIPFFNYGGKKYVCLNRHDFKTIAFETSTLYNVPLPRAAQSLKSFSYKIAHLPEFKEEQFTHRFLDFNFRGRDYHFNIKVNQALDTLFVNYPVVDYEAYFNIPMSATTYNTLMPELKKAIKDLSQADGLSYLMEFTRNAFAYESDTLTWGKEQRYAPELTLLRDKSDCDDRVALLYFLVKELYNLPMVVAQYKSHVVLGVNVPQAKGFSIDYEGKSFLLLDPTPQEVDLKIGEINPALKKQHYEIGYAYLPH